MPLHAKWCWLHLGLWPPKGYHRLPQEAAQTANLCHALHGLQIMLVHSTPAGSTPHNVRVLTISLSDDSLQASEEQVQHVVVVLAQYMRKVLLFRDLQRLVSGGRAMLQGLQVASRCLLPCDAMRVEHGCYACLR